MDGGAGLAIGMSCGMGAGIGSGIAIGRAGLQQEMLNRVKEMEMSYSIQIKDISGNGVTLEDFVRELSHAKSKECEIKSKKWLVVMAGLLAVAGLLGAVLFIML